MLQNKKSKIADRSSTTIFLGTPQFAATILDALLTSDFRPSLVVTEPDKPVGRRQLLTPSPVAVVAERAGIVVAKPATKDQLLTCLTDTQADLGIVAAYGHVLTKPMLAATRRGYLNVHASLLPNYRGATPIQAAILGGETETGLTIMKLDEGLDTGPIVSWAPVSIEANETAGQLTDRLAEVGRGLLIATLPGYLDGTIVSQPQPFSSLPVTVRLTRDSGQLTGSESAVRILRMLRAYHPWPGVWFAAEGQRVLLLSAHQFAGQLVPDQLQLASKKPVDWAAFQRDRPSLAQKVIKLLHHQA